MSELDQVTEGAFISVSFGDILRESLAKMHLTQGEGSKWDMWRKEGTYQLPPVKGRGPCWLTLTTWPTLY